jgi:hypothetical protein
MPGTQIVSHVDESLSGQPSQTFRGNSQNVVVAQSLDGDVIRTKLSIFGRIRAEGKYVVMDV